MQMYLNAIDLSNQLVKSQTLNQLNKSLISLKLLPAPSHWPEELCFYRDDVSFQEAISVYQSDHSRWKLAYWHD